MRDAVSARTRERRQESRAAQDASPLPLVHILHLPE